jgi:SAM-dependent methyltransferase
MSGDGPSKVAPGLSHAEAEPLDDIILGEDEPMEVPPVAPKQSSPPPLRIKTPEHPSAPPPPIKTERSSNRVTPITEADAREAQRKRAKLTLRIPDDEISRPNLPAPTPVGGMAVVSQSRPPSAPELGTKPDGSRSSVIPRPMTGPPPPAFGADDTIELPSDALRARLAALTGDVALRAPAVGIDPSHDAGWTPFQPEVDDDIGPPILPTPIVELRDPPRVESYSDPRETVLDTYEVHNSSPPVSEDIPVDMEVSEPSSDEHATYPRLPRALDSEEIRLEDGDRTSETGEVEVAPEDLVSVESLPSPAHQPPPVKTAGKYPAFKEPTPAPLSAPSPSRPPVSGTNTPSQPPVTMSSPNAMPPAGNAQVTSAPGPAARRQSNPLVFVPPVGALAPPPMTDTAAWRKKTRPWWEELFNDDFIRTMAKVTDAQIGKEVNFIEESLGCEAGAMILDLACGTGRHAVELAARGYQVVGFDLSLAMLARASDEAQDRKQKINFVQGDMREMTFEETFDGVYSWNTSFGYFDEEKNGAVIARVHKALKKGGQFLLDVVNRDYIVRQAPSLAWFEGDGCICMDEMTIDFITSRMKVKRTLMMDDGRTKEIEYSIRTYALHELGKMLHDNGFRVAEVSGRTGTPGVFFGCESPRTLILAEKR